MTWWQMLLDSPAQIGIIAAVVVVIVMVPLFSLGWVIRGWWISKRPDGPVIIEIKRLQQKVNTLVEEDTKHMEKFGIIRGYVKGLVEIIEGEEE